MHRRGRKEWWKVESKWKKNECMYSPTSLSPNNGPQVMLSTKGTKINSGYSNKAAANTPTVATIYKALRVMSTYLVHITIPQDRYSYPLFIDDATRSKKLMYVVLHC